MSGLCAHNIPFFSERCLAKLKVYQAQNSIVKKLPGLGWCPEFEFSGIG